MADLLVSALTIVVPFVLVLSVVVFVHEFGHFQVARWAGVKIETFSIGFGKALAQWTDRQGVIWKIGALPLGGYVKFVGDEDAASKPSLEAMSRPRDPSTRLFHDQNVSVRAAIVAAGPAANFIFAILAFALLYGLRGEVLMLPKVGQVQAGTPAAAAGFQPGDLVLRADGRTVESFDDLRMIVGFSANREILFDIERNGTPMQLTATPERAVVDSGFGFREEQGRLGLGWQAARENVVEVRYNPIEAVGRGAQQTWSIVEGTFKFVGALIRGGMSTGHLSGPAGIAQISGEVAKSGAESGVEDGDWLKALAGTLLALASFAAVLSVSVGLINLMPVPVLDGGHLLYYAFEAVMGKPLSPEIQAAGFRIGLACILALFAFATFNDLERFGLFDALGRLFS